MNAVKPTIPIPTVDAAVVAHLNMVQNAINRFATQSASCKSWCLSVIGALLSFAAATKTPPLTALAVLPLVVFTMMDAFYLACERAFRGLWSAKVARLRIGTYAAGDLFDLTAPVSVTDWLRAFVSISIWPAYLAMLLVCMLVLVYVLQPQ